MPWEAKPYTLVRVPLLGRTRRAAADGREGLTALPICAKGQGPGGLPGAP
jgi:hypothetical protein